MVSAYSSLFPFIRAIDSEKDSYDFFFMLDIIEDTNSFRTYPIDFAVLKTLSRVFLEIIEEFFKASDTALLEIFRRLAKSSIVTFFSSIKSPV